MKEAGVQEECEEVEYEKNARELGCVRDEWRQAVRCAAGVLKSLQGTVSKCVVHGEVKRRAKRV
jgi:hypothetical protein